MEKAMISQPVRLPFHRSLRFSASLLVTATLLIMSTSAYAQTCSANLDFKDVSTSFYVNYSNSLSRTVGGSLSGSVRNGSLSRLSFTFRPQPVNSTNKINIFGGSYNSNSAAVRPIYTCSESASTLRITIMNAHTKVDYAGTGVTSLGLGTITILVDKRGGPGKLNIQYKHQTFSRPPDQHSKLFNGSLLTDASPLSGGRLTVQNLFTR